MAKNIQLQNAAGNEDLFPKTKASIVVMDDGTNVEEEFQKTIKSEDYNGGMDADIAPNIINKVNDLSSQMVDLKNQNNYLLERLGLIEGLLPKINDLPILYLTGDIGGISATNKVTLDCKLIDVNGLNIFKDKKCKLEWQGNSSLSYPKKNYSIDLLNADGSKYKHQFFEDVEKNDSYHLKANYIDATHARNVVIAKIASKIYKDNLNGARGVIDGFPILLYYNGEKQGIYTWNLKQHATVYKLDKENPNHLMYRAEISHGAGSFLALSSSDSDWEERFPKTGLQENRDKLNRIIAFVKDSSNEDFRNNISKYLDLDFCIDYYILVYYFGIIDNMAKNMNLVTYDGLIWYPTLYDMDSSLGLYWNGASNVPATTPCPDGNYYGNNISLLWSKLVTNFDEEIKNRYFELRESILSLDSVKSELTSFIDSIPQKEYEFDRNKWTGIPTVSKNSGLEYMKTWITTRANYIDALMRGEEPDTTEPIQPTQGDYSLINQVFDGTNIVDTGIKLFDTDKDFTIFIDFQNSSDNPEYPVLLDNLTKVSPWDGMNIKFKKQLSATSGSSTVTMSNSLISTDTIRYKLILIKNSLSATVKVYANNKIQQTGTLTNINQINGYNLCIGGEKDLDGSNPRNHWKGTIHKCEVWFKELTEGEIVYLLS